MRNDENQKTTRIKIANSKKTTQKIKRQKPDNGSECSEYDEDDVDKMASKPDDFLNAFASVMDTENVDEFRFGPHLWKVNEFLVQPYMDFLDVDGPLHQLSSNSGLFECFLSLHSNLLVG
jgi:hypothetical protein